jgi:hypothetical protein
VSAQTIAYSGQLVVNTCWCGMRHAVPKELDEFQQRQHDNGEEVTSIYCPLGHTYIPSGIGAAERLRRRLASEEDERARVAAERDQAQASARARKGAATKARKRSAAAVCPCCHRSFKQLRRHMENKHPDFDPEKV